MRWVGLTYSLPSGSSSSPRVALWRRVRQLGAVSPTGSLYLLPMGEQHLEALGWLAQEIEAAGGEALVLRIESLEGEAEQRAVELSRGARAEEYRKITAEAEEASPRAGGDRRARGTRGAYGAGGETLRAERRDQLEKLRRRLAEVARIDFFQAPEGAEAAAALARLEASLGRGESPSDKGPRAERARYQGRRWVTRPRPHVDRLASAWLIRRFVDPKARIRYGDTPQAGEVSFDMRDAEFGHRGNRCTFETLIAAFGLGEDPALVALAEIVHEIDLRDGRYARPEIPGVDGLLRGWASAGWSDAELERQGLGLFEGLYLALQPAGPAAPGKRASRKAPRAARAVAQASRPRKNLRARASRP